MRRKNMMDGLPHFFMSVEKRLWSVLPEGGTLPEDVWQKRYSFLLGLTWFHAIVIALIGPLLGYRWELSIDAITRDGNVLHTLFEGLIIALFAAVGSIKWIGRTLQAVAVAMGLMTASAMLVHLSGGYIEIHFHFFVMLAFLALLQDWVPYVLAIVYVAVHHGVVGALWPEEVFNHAAATTLRGRGPVFMHSSFYGPASAALWPGDSTKKLWTRLKNRPRS